MAEGMAVRPSRAARTILALDRAATKPWFLPAVGVFPLADYALPFLPNQILLVALSSLRPRLWWRLALMFAVAGGLGAAALAAALQAVGPQLLALVGGAPRAGVTADLVGAVQVHGLWALTAVALLPPTPRAAVIICALAGLPPTAIGVAVATGRLLPVSLLTVAGAAAPQLVRRMPSFDRLLREVEAARTPESPA